MNTENTAVIRKLKTIEPTVRKLLSLARPSVLTKEKLEQMEQYVAEIPDENVAMIWRERLAYWYVMFDGQLMQQQGGTDSRRSSLASESGYESPSMVEIFDSESKNEELLASDVPSEEQQRAQYEEDTGSTEASGTSDVNFNETQRKQPGLRRFSIATARSMPTPQYSILDSPNEELLPPAGPTTTDAFPSSLDCIQLIPIQAPAIIRPLSALSVIPEQPETFSHHSDEDTTSIVDTEVQPNKDAVRAQLKVAFSTVALIHSAQDIESIKKLAQVLARSQQAIAPFRNDGTGKPYVETLFWALSKLPDELRDEYRAKFGSKPKLSTLIAFLCSLISTFYKRQETSTALSDDGDFDEAGRLMRCNYCHAIGHTILVCPDIKQLLCFKCFQTGHTLKRCTAFTPNE